MMIRMLFALVLWVLLLSFSSLTQDETSELPPIAGYDVNGDLTVWGIGDSPVVLSSEWEVWDVVFSWGTDRVVSMIWSPNGDILAYLEDSGGRFTTPIGLFNVGDFSMGQIDTRAVPGTPMTFAQDGVTMYYTAFGEPRPAPQPEGFTGTWQQFFLLMMEVEPIDNAEPESISDVPLRSVHEIELTSGGGFWCPIETVAYTETRSYATFVPQLLVDTPYGLLSYYEDQLLLDDSPLGLSELHHFAVSPDYERLATAQGESTILTIDIGTLTTQSYETDASIQALAWNGGQYVYYTSVEYGETLITEEDWQLPGMEYMVCDATINRVTIHQLDLETGEQREVYTGSYFAVNWLTVSPDGSEIYFSAVPNGEAWLENKRIDACDVDGCIADLMPSMYRLDLATGEVDLILENVLLGVPYLGEG